jgi:hypothetical protein
VPRRHARMATIRIIRMRARLMATMVRNGFREACSLAPVPGITAGTVATATDTARIMVVADGLGADTIGRAPMHIVAEQAMRVAELAMPAVAFPTARAAAAAPMVVADVAEWFE